MNFKALVESPLLSVVIGSLWAWMEGAAVGWEKQNPRVPLFAPVSRGKTVAPVVVAVLLLSMVLAVVWESMAPKV